jgi:hypothetical protein
MELPFQIVQKDGYNAIKYKPGVAIIAYQVDSDQLLDKVGIVKEKNPFRVEGFHRGPIMGTIEKDDKSVLARAMQETLEEAGYETDSSRWMFLGELLTTKMDIVPIQCYAVDLTGLQGSKPMGDGSDHEKDISFEFVSLNEAYEIPDAVLQASFFRLFNSLYKKDVIDGVSK